MFVVMRGCCGAWLPRCVAAAVIAGTGVRAVPAPGSGCVWVVPACVGFEAGTAGGPAARRCAYFVGRRGGGPVCWGSGFCFGRAGVCSVYSVCFVPLESASVFRCSVHAFVPRAQVVLYFYSRQVPPRFLSPCNPSNTDGCLEIAVAGKPHGIASCM